MKYKLINSQTKEETLCDKVTIDGYDYYFTNQLPKLGDVVYNCKSKEIYKITIEEEIVNYEFPIVCGNNPNNIDIPKVVDEVEELAKEATNRQLVRIFGVEDRDEVLDDIKKRKFYFKEGYNKSKETHPNSDEDMIEFAEWRVINLFFNTNFSTEKLLWKSNNKLFNGTYTTKELLQLWKEQKPKTLYYE